MSQPFLDAGIGVATFYYGDVDPDYPDGLHQWDSRTLPEAGTDGTRGR